MRVLWTKTRTPVVDVEGHPIGQLLARKQVATITFVSKRKVVRLRVDEFDRLTTERKLVTDAMRAEAIGVSPGHLSNVRSGANGVGLAFADGCIRLFGAKKYKLLFERVEEGDGRGSGQD